MGSKGYTAARMSEAIALATIVGAEAASERTGIQARTIRKWCARAGKAPADGIARTDWAALGELARARVAAELASGRLSAVQVATIAGIAEHNMRDAPEAPAESAVAALEAFTDWVVDAGHVTSEDDYDAIRRELIVRANAEDGQPRRQAQLAWFSHRPEVPAGNVLDWAKAQTLAVLAEHGSFARLREWHRAREAERHDVMLAQLAANQQAAEAWARRALDADIEGALGEAQPVHGRSP